MSTVWDNVGQILAITLSLGAAMAAGCKGDEASSAAPSVKIEPPPQGLDATHAPPPREVTVWKPEGEAQAKAGIVTARLREASEGGELRCAKAGGPALWAIEVSARAGESDVAEMKAVVRRGARVLGEDVSKDVGPGEVRRLMPSSSTLGIRPDDGTLCAQVAEPLVISLLHDNREVDRVSLKRAAVLEVAPMIEDPPPKAQGYKMAGPAQGTTPRLRCDALPAEASFELSLSPPEGKGEGPLSIRIAPGGDLFAFSALESGSRTVKVMGLPGANACTMPRYAPTLIAGAEGNKPGVPTPLKMQLLPVSVKVELSRGK